MTDITRTCGSAAGRCWRVGPDHAACVGAGVPQLALACIDGTAARAHQKAAGVRSSKPTMLVGSVLARGPCGRNRPGPTAMA
jgi:hypothetical protein